MAMVPGLHSSEEVACDAQKCTDTWPNHSFWQQRLQSRICLEILLVPEGEQTPPARLCLQLERQMRRTWPLGDRQRLAHYCHNRPGLGQEPIWVPQQPPAHKGGYAEPQHTLRELLRVPCQAVLLYCYWIKEIILPKAENRHKMGSSCQGNPDKAFPAHDICIVSMADLQSSRDSNGVLRQLAHLL